MIAAYALYIIGLALIIAAAYSGQKIDQNNEMRPLSRRMYVFLDYGSGASAILGILYFVVGFFVFGLWTFGLLLSALLVQFIPLKLLQIYSGYTPLLCATYIVLANICCTLSLLL